MRSHLSRWERPYFLYSQASCVAHEIGYRGERERESSEGWIEKIKVNFEALSPGYLTALHSRTGVGFNDTIVSR